MARVCWQLPHGEIYKSDPIDENDARILAMVLQSVNPHIRHWVEYVL